MNAHPEAIIPVSKATWHWLRQGDAARLGLRHRMAYAWNAFWFDVNWKLQAQALDNALAPASPDPVFILGLWRSGTSFAHDLLSACSGLVAPTTRQCMNASTFALTRRPPRNASITRPMDAMEISADSPQEDEFALLALGVPSVYRAFLDPARTAELERLLSPDYWVHEAPAQWDDAWRDFLGFVQRQGGASQRLLLKSPNHSFRIKAIERLFPQGRHLWITRSPHDLLDSNRNMWAAMCKRYGVSEGAEQRLDSLLLRAFEQASCCLDWLCANVGRDRLAVIDFARLIADPAGVLTEAGARLGLGERVHLREAIEVAARKHANHRVEVFAPKALPAEADRVFATLIESQRRALASHGLRDGVEH